MNSFLPYSLQILVIICIYFSKEILAAFPIDIKVEKSTQERLKPDPIIQMIPDQPSILRRQATKVGAGMWRRDRRWDPEIGAYIYPDYYAHYYEMEGFFNVGSTTEKLAPGPGIGLELAFRQLMPLLPAFITGMKDRKYPQSRAQYSKDYGQTWY